MMTLESLLLSHDLETVRVLRPALEKLSIEVEICQEARAATEIIIAEKFDAILVDCDDLSGGLEVLQGIRATPSNRSSVAFAILNGKKTTTQEAFGMGVNFVLQKPITPLNASRCLHAALGFMEREKRRYYRYPVKMLVKAVLGDREIKATSTNISEGGIALILHQALPKGASPRVQFTLPGTGHHLDVETVVAWADIKGLVGLRFMNVPEDSQKFLETWLSRQLDDAPSNHDQAGGSADSVQ